MLGPWLLCLLLAAPAKGSGSADEPPRGAGPPVRMDKDDVLIGRYRLTPKPSGGYRSRIDSFTAFVAADGAVTFEDAPRLPGVAVLPALLAAEVIRSKATKHSRDPLEEAKASVQRPLLPIAEDDLRRDPHHAKKMDFIETTAHFREGLQRRNDRTALGSFRRLVQSVATDARVPAARRRQNLVELWSECDETDRGAPARAVVEEAARRHFPAGSADAFTPAELARAGSAPGGLRFDPYAAAAIPAAAPAVTSPKSPPTR